MINILKTNPPFFNPIRLFHGHPFLHFSRLHRRQRCHWMGKMMINDQPVDHHHITLNHTATRGWGICLMILIFIVFSAEAIFASLARSSASFCASLALLSSASFSFFARSSSYQWRHLVVLGPFGWQFQECWAPFLGCRQAGSEVEPKWVWVNIEPPKKVAVVITYAHCIIYANIYSTCTC